MIEARVPTSTSSPECESSELKTDQASVSRIQKEVEFKEGDYELNGNGNVEGNGVLYSEKCTEESLMDGSQDALGGKDVVDPSIPCHTTIDEP